MSSAWIGGDAGRGVDDARNLRERAAYAPARDRYKIFIIDEAHMVSTQGFNALLKIVEEPPAHVRFVFATTEPGKVIGTIRSRTHHYPFRLVPPERLQAYLAELCQAEGVAIGHGVLPLVVRAGGGSVRDSLSVLDQLIAGAGPDGLDYPMAVSLLGYTDNPAGRRGRRPLGRRRCRGLRRGRPGDPVWPRSPPVRRGSAGAAAGPAGRGRSAGRRSRRPAIAARRPARAVALALWLARWDIARFTIRQQGLPRYIALALWCGYLWLAVSGAAWLAGSRDAALHALGVGFVLSMIMAHAPVILSAVAGLRVAYTPLLVLPLALLQLSVALRLALDLRIGAWLHLLALVGFVLTLARGVHAAARTR